MTHDLFPSFARTSRRSFLGAVFAGGALLAIGADAAPALAASAVRPGLLHAPADLQAVQAHLAAGQQPWTNGLGRLTANGRSSSSWSPRPVSTVVRGGGVGENYSLLYLDIAAAYQNALRWRLQGSAQNGATAANIINAWSSTLTTITGDADRFLAAGIYGYQFANAVELMRDHPALDLDAAITMLLTVFYPMNDDFLRNHNGAVISNYWANWDLCSMCSVLAIGGVADRPDLVDRAIDYFANGAGMGSIENAVPFLYDGGLGQWQESGRDQGHTMLGIGLMGAFCEMAWNLGHDCYGHDDNRFMKGAEYVAKYNLGNEVPFTTYWKQSGPLATTLSWTGWSSQTVISPASRGQIRPIWDLLVGHYAGRKNLDIPWITQFAALSRPEGGGGDYGGASGGYDQLGFGTLTSYRVFVSQVNAAPVPSASTATGESAPAGAAPSPEPGGTPDPSAEGATSAPDDPATPIASPARAASSAASTGAGRRSATTVTSAKPPGSASAATERGRVTLTSDTSAALSETVPIGLAGGALLALVGIKIRRWFARR